jgi:CRP/FNR family cyclic AMP-dependent transcriptional regulator
MGVSGRVPNRARASTFGPHMSELPEALRWLGSIEPGDEVFLRESQRLEFAAGETVFQPASHPRSVYLVEKGLVRIFRLDESGAEIAFGYIGPGEVFGELSTFSELPRESFAVAVQASTVRKLPRPAFEKLVRARPDRVFEVTRQISERLKRIESRLEHFAFRDVRARLGSILLELAHDFGVRDGARTRIELPLTQSELATLIGATRQTVNATLAELREAGLVVREAGRLVVVDPDALARALRPS